MKEGQTPLEDVKGDYLLCNIKRQFQSFISVVWHHSAKNSIPSITLPCCRCCHRNEPQNCNRSIRLTVISGHTVKYCWACHAIRQMSHAIVMSSQLSKNNNNKQPRSIENTCLTLHFCEIRFSEYVLLQVSDDKSTRRCISLRINVFKRQCKRKMHCEHIDLPPFYINVTYFCGTMLHRTWIRTLCFTSTTSYKVSYLVNWPCQRCCPYWGR